MSEAKRATRRRHTESLKHQVLEECARPGASVANIALAHGLNANLVHKWRRLSGGKRSLEPAAAAPSFVPVALAAAPSPLAGDIRIELRRGPILLTATWPLAAREECAAWVREILK